MVSFTTRPLYPQRNSPWYPLDRRLGKPQEPVWMMWKRENSWSYQDLNFKPLGFPACSQSLYRLHYPNSYLKEVISVNLFAYRYHLTHFKVSNSPEWKKTTGTSYTINFFLEHKSSTHLWRLTRFLLFCSPHSRGTSTLELDSPTTGSPHSTHLGFLRCTCHNYRTLAFKFKIMILSINMVSSSTLRNHNYQGTNAASVHQSARIPISGHLSARQTVQTHVTAAAHWWSHDIQNGITSIQDIIFRLYLLLYICKEKKEDYGRILTNKFRDFSTHCPWHFSRHRWGDKQFCWALIMTCASWLSLQPGITMWEYFTQTGTQKYAQFQGI
jgi:hypothetical protein